ncbi:hypothetical protein PEC302107_21990 [Pectobacterium araliae]|nr:hypothetical protein PEC302107_21990 [Pectobacterium carotovorum subsp. carotovorum]
MAIWCDLVHKNARHPSNTFGQICPYLAQPLNFVKKVEINRRYCNLFN